MHPTSDQFHNKHNQFSRTGTVLRTDKVTKSMDLIDYAMDKIKQRGFHVDFDCTHNNGGTYSVHEFCGALGGISLRYMDFNTHMRVLREGLMSNPVNFKNYADMLTSIDVNDKYKLRNTMSKQDKVVFLSGSNLLRLNIDFELVAKAVEDGAVIKPHPVTHAQDMKWLKEKFGKSKVLAPKVSGGQLIRNAKKVYVAKNSEIWFLAVAHGIIIEDIGLPEFTSEVYRPIINTVMNNHFYLPKVALNRIFSSPLSGIYFSKEQIDSEIDIYIDRVEEIRNLQ